MTDQIRELISRAAEYTPSGDNCQPFRCQWIQGTFTVVHDSNLAAHKLNFKNYASLLSLGCLIEAVKITAEDNGYQVQISFDAEDPLQKVEFQFHKSDLGTKSNLSKYISKRNTDRRNYLGGWDDQFAQQFQKIAAGYDCSIQVIQHLPKDVRSHFLKSDSIFWKDQNVFFDTLKWVRFKSDDVIRKKDGLSAKNLGLDALSGPILWLASRHKIMQKIFRYTGSIVVGRLLLQRQLDTSAGFIFVSPKSFDKNDIVQSGQLFFRLWLQITEMNYAAQPITLPTLMPYLSQHLDLTESFDMEVNEMLKSGAEIMKKELALPIWGLRFGKVDSPLPSQALTWRRNIS